MDLLPWLPLHADLGAAIAEARGEPDALKRLVAAARLAAYRRDFTLGNRIDRLATAGLEAVASGEAAPGFTPVRAAILASHTVDHLVPAIRVAGLARGVALAVHVAPYGQYRQALLGDDPALQAFAPQVILLALDAHEAPLQLPLTATRQQVAAAVSARVEELRLLWRTARERHAAQVVQQLLVPVHPALFGALEAAVPASPRAVTEALNAAIRAAAADDGVLLLDLDWQAPTGGWGEGLADPVRWHQAKQLVSPVLAPLYGDLVARIAAAVVGRSRKCVVLDLDNTLWGGVVGDDGIEALLLGQGSPEGEAFLAFQQYVSQLARRGVILAVCSKNDDAVARAAFEHPEMVLKPSDIAAFVANWNDKAANLRQIAATLSIGLDSLVFMDDNPAERDIVRRELPEVAVPELPSDVAGYPARVAAAGYFEAVSFTVDDAARGRSYAQNAQRAAGRGQATDMAGYLRGLEMKLTATGVGPAELARVTQLINKTNQFNLTTRRYTEDQVRRLAADPAGVALAIRLADKYGDNGLISVVLARPDAALAPGELLIDSWLMSCRVLGRQVELAVLEVLVREAAQRGATALVGEYRPTGRNGMVEAHFQRLGFEPFPPPSDAEPGSTFWRFEIRTGQPWPHFIEITRP